MSLLVSVSLWSSRPGPNFQSSFSLGEFHYGPQKNNSSPEATGLLSKLRRLPAASSGNSLKPPSTPPTASRNSSNMSNPRESDASSAGDAHESPGSTLLQQSYQEWEVAQGLVEPSTKQRLGKQTASHLVDLEKLLMTSRPLKSWWVSDRLNRLLLENGTIVNLMVADHHANIEGILIDRTISNQHSSSLVADLVLADQFCIYSHRDSAKLYCIEFTGQKSSATVDIRKLKPISALNPRSALLKSSFKFTTKESPHISINTLYDSILVWWPSSHMQVAGNCLVFRLVTDAWDLLCEMRTETQFIDVVYSKKHPQVVYSLEFDTRSKTTAMKNITRSVNPFGKIEVLAVSSIHLPSQFVAYARNASEDRLVIGCINGELAMCDSQGLLATHSTSMSPISKIEWHPGGAMFVVASALGIIQVIDVGLNILQVCVLSDGLQRDAKASLDLPSWLGYSAGLSLLSWSQSSLSLKGQSTKASSHLLCVFDRGPIFMVRVELGAQNYGKFGPYELVSEYLRMFQISKAVRVLQNLSWSPDDRTTLCCLSSIVTALINRQYASDTEELLLKTLKCFPCDPTQGEAFTFAMQSSPVAGMWFDIQMLWRKAFFAFVRWRAFEQAFRFASILNASDLFTCLHAQASLSNELVLSELALQRAGLEDLEATNPLARGAQTTDTAAQTNQPALLPLNYDAAKLVLQGKWHEAHETMQKQHQDEDAGHLRELLAMASSESGFDFTELL